MPQKSDVEAAYTAFVKWKVARDANTAMAVAGNINPIIENVRSTGEVGKLRDDMLSKIEHLDSFANDKAILFYADSIALRNKMNLVLLVLIVAILIITIIGSLCIYQTDCKSGRRVNRCCQTLSRG